MRERARVRESFSPLLAFLSRPSHAVESEKGPPLSLSSLIKRAHFGDLEKGSSPPSPSPGKKRRKKKVMQRRQKT